MIESDGVYLYDVQPLEHGGEARGITGNYTKLTLAVTDDVVTATYVDYLGASRRSNAGQR